MLRLTGIGEFRGSEDRTSKNGNKYKFLRFEDDGGSVFQFYYKLNDVFNVPVSDLEKGKCYHLEFGYSYNSYDRRYQLALLDVMGAVNE